MKALRITVGVILPVLLLLACSASTSPEPVEQPLDLSAYENQYGLLLVWEGGSSSEIYEIQSDGSGFNRLTDNNIYDHTPFWSADAASIFFTTIRNDELLQVFRMNSDGSGATILSAGGCNGQEIAVSPLANQLAFIETCDGTDAALVVCDADGSQRKSVVSMVGISEPSWSPDGEQLVFTAIDTHFVSRSIFIIDKDGDNLQQLTQNAYGEHNPQWSPDGNRIYFYSDDAGPLDIFSMNVDGSDRRNLTTNAATDFMPVPAPDGSRIVFTSDRDGDRELYIMNSDGSGVRGLTDVDHNLHFFARWSPDGTRLSFSVDADKNGANDSIFILDVETGSSARLTDGYLVTDWTR